MSETTYSDNFEPAAPVSGEGVGAVEAIEPTPAEASKNESRTSLWNYPATYTLLVLNIAVYAIMFHLGPIPDLIHSHDLRSMLATPFHLKALLLYLGDIFTAPFDSSVLERFGATSSDAINQGGQWWRLVTGTFVHVTLLHILLNMWCLWNLGLFGEPLLGRRGLVAVYLLTGISGMILSYSWSLFWREPTLVAGASGAVFGMAGILIVLLSNRKLNVPWEELRQLRRQVIYFAVINLVLGMLPKFLGYLPQDGLSSLHLDNLPRIDNSAHLGGFLSGLALGVPLFPKMTSGRANYRRRQAITYGTAAFLLCLIGYALTKFV